MGDFWLLRPLSRVFDYSHMPKSLFSIRGLLIGIALSLAVGLLAPYGVVFNYYWVGFNPSSPGALFLFFVLTFAVNGFVALLGRHFALAKADLVLIYCMLMMAVTVPTWGLMFFLIGTIVYPFYYATPENSYAELFYDFIPSWIARRRTLRPSRITTRACRKVNPFRGTSGWSRWPTGWL